MILTLDFKKSLKIFSPNCNFMSLGQKKESLFLMTLVVAGAGLEPATFGL